MKPAHTIQPLCAALLAAAALPATQARAQVVDPNPVTVTGQKMPRAEAPRSATCEALARDPSFRAMVAAAGGDPLMMIGDPEYYERFFGFSAAQTADWRIDGPVERRRLLAYNPLNRPIARTGRILPRTDARFARRDQFA
jgi:hypothetical protein